MQWDSNKEILRKTVGKVIKKLRGKRSQFIFCAENGISTSIISNLERGLKDPQLTTIFKIAEAFNLSASDFIKMVEEELPDKISFIDN